MITPDLQKATGLDPDMPSKQSLKVTDQIEQFLINGRWIAGDVLGSETELAVEYGTTPQVMRQAFRVLEWRGLGRTRRGAAGGFMVQHPPLAVTGQRLMAFHLMAHGVCQDDVRAARTRLLARLPSNRPDLAASRSFVVNLFDHIEGAWDDRPSLPNTENRAQRIAQQILRHRGKGGSEWCTVDDLINRFSACRAIIVQALRILESLGFAVGVRGRSGGFRLVSPHPVTLVRATLSHFVAQGIDIDICDQLVTAVNQVNISTASLTTSDATTLRLLASRVQVRDIARGDFCGAVALMRHIADCAGNHVLHMLVRCLWCYWYHCVTSDPATPLTLPVSLVSQQVVMAQNMVQAMLDGRPEQAAAALDGYGLVARSIQQTIRGVRASC
ncbi:MAG: GntR family transcriptional regulator [Niveispirillum sp.]|uniref:GntR family transcriptional regulator n=1 Tax=Niveispirillum sp. TaxID=1917217 RepID=UPI003BA45460